MHIHIDPVGGVAGDMFVAALLNAFPHLEAETLSNVRRVAPVQCDLLAFNDGVLSGARFEVARDEAAEQDGHHHHRHWADICASHPEGDKA